MSLESKWKWEVGVEEREELDPKCPHSHPKELGLPLRAP